ncbi:DUF5926 family protein [Devriesea agamarum]|uniref:DUF5926 family protein n=1 Tax=Devriesea agamarum TaxID=472569 RepID=UPI00071CAA4E|nr:DUF5926 family protein [Devriesea agamarum]
MAATSPDVLVRRPFAGLGRERDLVAMRELIPSATVPARTRDGVPVVIATVLPMAYPAVRRTDGSVIVGLQASVPGGDLSRAFGQAIAQALEVEPGTAVEKIDLTADSPRLQDLLDIDPDVPVTVHDTFEFWLDASAERTEQVEAALKEANASILPTKAVKALPHAFWVDAGSKEHLRWVLDADEDRVIDAIARLHARHDSGLGEGTRYVGSFRADGLTIPVWDLPKGFGVDGVEEVASDLAQRMHDALACTDELTPRERRARGGIVARQVTLR